MRVPLMFLIFIFSSSYLSAQLDSLKVRDSRYVNTNPSTYSKVFVPQLRYYTSTGLPYVGTGFSTLLGFRAWGSDNSGGKAHELNFSDDNQMYFRSGNGTSWEPWKKTVFESDGKVGIGTASPKTTLDLNDLRLGSITELPPEQDILEGTFGNYILGDATVAQRLWLGVSNDGYTRAEIFIDNSNRADGTISLKTANANGGAITRMFIDGNGSVSIGTTDAKGYRFAVNGDAMFTKVKIKSYSAWPDYVFEDEYQLPSLKEVEKYIRTYKRLPEVPGADQVESEGLDVSSTHALLLKKIEELTLYLIEQEKRLEQQERRLSIQQEEMDKLKSRQ